MSVLDPIKLAKAKITNNYIGGVAGGIAGYYAARKLGKVSNKLYLVAAVLAGVVGGAYAQSAIKAKQSAPKKSDT